MLPPAVVMVSSLSLLPLSVSCFPSLRVSEGRVLGSESVGLEPTIPTPPVSNPSLPFRSVQAVSACDR